MRNAFAQRLLTAPSGPQPPLARFVDFARGRALDGALALRDAAGRWPDRLRVEWQPIWPHDHAPLLNALHHLRMASVRHGQPIVWE